MKYYINNKLQVHIDGLVNINIKFSRKYIITDLFDLFANDSVKYLFASTKKTIECDSVEKEKITIDSDLTNYSNFRYMIKTFENYNQWDIVNSKRLALKEKLSKRRYK